MKYALFDLLGAALVPELRADVPAGTAGDIELRLVGVAALRALPDKLSARVLDDFDLAVEPALLAVVALRVELGVHDVVVDVAHDRENRRQVVLHVRNLDIRNRAARRELLELRLGRELGECVDRLGDVDMVRVRDVIAVGDALDDAETLLETLREAVRGRLDGRAVERIVDILGGLPLGGVLVEFSHDLKAELLAVGFGELFAVKREDAFPKPGVTERNRGVAAVEKLVDRLALTETRERAVLPENGSRVGNGPLETVVTAAERLVAKLAALVENAPEPVDIAVGRESDVDEVDRDDALIEASVELRLSGLVVKGVRDVPVTAFGAVGRKERAAAHAGVAVALADALAGRKLVLAHFLLGNVVGHHALGGALRRKFGQIPVGRILRDVLLFENVDEFRERGGHVNALLVLDALDALAEHLFDDEREIPALGIVLRLAQIHEHGDERRLTVGRHEGDHLILDRLNALLNLFSDALLDDLREHLVAHLNTRLVALLLKLLADRLARNLDERREMGKRNRLAAVLVRGDLGDNLRRDVAGGREALGLFDHRARNHRSILKHILEVHKVAVVHVLRVIIHVVEMDDALLVGLNDVGGQ